MTIEELNAIVPEEQREAVGTLIEEIKTGANPLVGINDEGYSKLLGGNPDLQKIHDARMTKGLDTWQKNNLDKLYTERYAKEHPDETDEQKRIKALEISNEESTRRADRATLTTETLRDMTADKISGELLDLMLADDAEATKGKITIFKSWLATHDEELKTELLKTNGRIPGETDPTVDDRYYTIEQINGMSPEQQFENQAKVDESLTYWQNQSRTA